MKLIISNYSEYSRLTYVSKESIANTTDDQRKILELTLIKIRLTRDWNYVSEIIAEDFTIKNGD